MKKGAVNLVALGIFVFITVLIPVTVKLVQQNQENRTKAAQECHNETRNVCAEYQEECHDEQYSCQTCGAYEQVCQKVNKSCVVGEKDDGRPIYGTCEEEECHDGACSFWENGSCTRNKCTSTGNCARWENQVEQVCIDVLPPPPSPPSTTCETGDCFHDCTVCGHLTTNECNTLCNTGSDPCLNKPPTCSGNNISTCIDGNYVSGANCSSEGRVCQNGICVDNKETPLPQLVGTVTRGFPNCDSGSCGGGGGAGWECVPDYSSRSCAWRQPPENYKEWKCAGGGNCDKCGVSGNGWAWWGDGCTEWCSDHPNEPNCKTAAGGVEGPLVTCRNSNNQCNSGGEPDVDTGCVNKVKTVKSGCKNGCWDKVEYYSCDSVGRASSSISDIDAIVNYYGPNACQELALAGVKFDECVKVEKEKLAKYLREQSAAAHQACLNITSGEPFEDCYQRLFSQIIAVRLGDPFNYVINPLTGEIHLTPESFKARNCPSNSTRILTGEDGYYSCQTGEKIRTDSVTETACRGSDGKYINYEDCQKALTKAQTACGNQDATNDCLFSEIAKQKYEVSAETQRLKTETAKLEKFCGDDGIKSDWCLTYYDQKIQEGYNIDLTAKSAVLDTKVVRENCPAGKDYISFQNDVNVYNCFTGRALDPVLKERYFANQTIDVICSQATGIQQTPDGYINCDTKTEATPDELQKYAARYCKDPNNKCTADQIVNSIKIDFVSKARFVTDYNCQGKVRKYTYNDGSSYTEENGVDCGLEKFAGEVAYTASAPETKGLLAVLNEAGFTEDKLQNAYEILSDYGVVKNGDYSIVVSPDEKLQVYKGNNVVFSTDFFPSPDKYSAKDGFADYQKVLLSKLPGSSHYSLTNPVETEKYNESCVAYFGANCDGTVWEVPLLRSIPKFQDDNRPISQSIEWLKSKIMGTAVSEEPINWTPGGVYNNFRDLVVGVGTFPAQWIISGLMARDYDELMYSARREAAMKMPANCRQEESHSGSNYSTQVYYFYDSSGCQSRYSEVLASTQATILETNPRFKMTTEVARKMAMMTTTEYVDELGREVTYAELINHPELFNQNFNPAKVQAGIEAASINPLNAIKGSLQAPAGVFMLVQSLGIGAARTAAATTVEKGLVAEAKNYFLGMPGRALHTVVQPMTVAFSVGEGALEMSHGQTVCNSLQKSYGVGCNDAEKIAVLPDNLKRQYEYAVEASSLTAGIKVAAKTAAQWAEFAALYGPVVGKIQEIASKPFVAATKFVSSRTAMVEKGPWTDLRVTRDKYQEIYDAVESTKNSARQSGNPGQAEQFGETILKKRLRETLGREPTLAEMTNWKLALSFSVPVPVAAKPQDKQLALPAPKQAIPVEIPILARFSEFARAREFGGAAIPAIIADIPKAVRDGVKALSNLSPENKVSKVVESAEKMFNAEGVKNDLNCRSGLCGYGAEANIYFAEVLGGTGKEYQLLKVQEQLRGVNPNDSFQHAFSIVDFDGKKFLVDTTFTQFMDKNTGKIMLKQAPEMGDIITDNITNPVAQALFTRGYVEFTDTNFREYLRITSRPGIGKNIREIDATMIEDVKPLETDYSSAEKEKIYKPYAPQTNNGRRFPSETGQFSLQFLADIPKAVGEIFNRKAAGPVTTEIIDPAKINLVKEGFKAADAEVLNNGGQVVSIKRGGVEVGKAIMDANGTVVANVGEKVAPVTGNSMAVEWVNRDLVKIGGQDVTVTILDSSRGLFHGGEKPLSVKNDFVFGSDESGDGSQTLGYGLYLTPNREAAVAYAKVRAYDHPGFVSEIIPVDARMLDLSVHDTVPSKIFEGWVPYWKKYYAEQLQLQKDGGLTSLQITLLERMKKYDEYVDRLIANSDFNRDIRTVLGYSSYSALRPIMSDAGLGEWRMKWSDYMRSLGIDGLIAIESGEGSFEGKDVVSYVFYNPEKIGTKEDWLIKPKPSAETVAVLNQKFGKAVLANPVVVSVPDWRAAAGEAMGNLRTRAYDVLYNPTLINVLQSPVLPAVIADPYKIMPIIANAINAVQGVIMGPTRSNSVVNSNSIEAAKMTMSVVTGNSKAVITDIIINKPNLISEINRRLQAMSGIENLDIRSTDQERLLSAIQTAKTKVNFPSSSIEDLVANLVQVGAINTGDGGNYKVLTLAGYQKTTNIEREVAKEEIKKWQELLAIGEANGFLEMVNEAKERIEILKPFIENGAVEREHRRMIENAITKGKVYLSEVKAFGYLDLADKYSVKTEKAQELVEMLTLGLDTLTPQAKIEAISFIDSDGREWRVGEGGNWYTVVGGKKIGGLPRETITAATLDERVRRIFLYQQVIPQDSLQSGFPLYESFSRDDSQKGQFLTADELIDQTEKFMVNLQNLSKPLSSKDTIFFLDKSARPLAYLFRKLFPIYYPNMEMPKIRYVNIGGSGSLIYDEDSRPFIGDPTVLKELYGNHINTSGNIYIVDEYTHTGAALASAEKVLTTAFPEAEVTKLSAYTKVPNWYQNEAYLGVEEYSKYDYERQALDQLNKELGTTYQDFLQILNTEVPGTNSSWRFWEIYDQLQGSIPYTKLYTNPYSNREEFIGARSELDKMIEKVINRKANNKSSTDDILPGSGPAAPTNDGRRFPSETGQISLKLPADILKAAGEAVNNLRARIFGGVPSSPVTTGTSAPEGRAECVTGDTLLKRRRKKKDSGRGQNDDFEDVPIKDIKEGDEVLTFEEKTGTFIPSIVEKLSVKGKQTVYELLTETGKSIKTTAEHPYLVKQTAKNGKFFGLDYAFVDEVGVSYSHDQPLFGIGAFVINDTIEINKELHDVLTEALSYYHKNVSQPGRFEFKFNAIKKNNVQFYRKILAILEKYDWNFWYIIEDKPFFYEDLPHNYIWERYTSLLTRISANFERDTAIVADYFDEPSSSKSDLRDIRNVANVCNIMQSESHGSLLLQVVDILVGAINFTGKFALSPDLSVHREKKEIAEAVIKILEAQKKRGYKLSSCLSSSDCINDEGPCQEENNLSTQIDADWIKVKNLKPGQKIVTIDGFETIKSINKLGREEVFDIQIANTHNFVGNGIVAHNTTLNVVTSNSGHNFSLPMESFLLKETRDILRQRFGLPPREMRIDNPLEFERLIIAMAEKEGLRVIGKPRSYFDEKKTSASFEPETKTILYNVQDPPNVRGLFLEHELVHALILIKYPGLYGTPFSEVFAYLVGAGDKFLDIGDAPNLLASLIDGSLNYGKNNSSQAIQNQPECVTGDTLLTISNDQIPISKQIKDIREGERVLTFDETSGKFIPQIVEKLLEKGVQQVFELETINGKKIRTTSEHPYLVGSGFFEEGNISEQGTGHSQSESDSNLNIEIKNIHNYLIRSFLSLKAAVKDNIPKTMFTVNKLRLNGNGFSVDNGTIIATPNQPDERLTSNSEKIDNKSGSNFLTNNSVNNAWIKVKYLKVGQKIMTIDGFEEIKSITKLGREEVFDIQIANTHNFVGNGIVAHNTTVSKNSSIKSSEIKFARDLLKHEVKTELPDEELIAILPLVEDVKKRIIQDGVSFEEENNLIDLVRLFGQGNPKLTKDIRDADLIVAVTLSQRIEKELCADWCKTRIEESKKRDLELSKNLEMLLQRQGMRANYSDKNVILATAEMIKAVFGGNFNPGGFALGRVAAVGGSRITGAFTTGEDIARTRVHEKVHTFQKSGGGYREITDDWLTYIDIYLANQTSNKLKLAQMVRIGGGAYSAGALEYNQLVRDLDGLVSGNLEGPIQDGEAFKTAVLSAHLGMLDQIKTPEIDVPGIRVLYDYYFGKGAFNKRMDRYSDYWLYYNLHHPGQDRMWGNIVNLKNLISNWRVNMVLDKSLSSSLKEVFEKFKRSGYKVELSSWRDLSDNYLSFAAEDRNNHLTYLWNNPPEIVISIKNKDGRVVRFIYFDKDGNYLGNIDGQVRGDVEEVDNLIVNERFYDAAKEVAKLNNSVPPPVKLYVYFHDNDSELHNTPENIQRRGLLIGTYGVHTDPFNLAYWVKMGSLKDAKVMEVEIPWVERHKYLEFNSSLSGPGWLDVKYKVKNPIAIDLQEKEFPLGRRGRYEYDYASKMQKEGLPEPLYHIPPEFVKRDLTEQIIQDATRDPFAQESTTTISEPKVECVTGDTKLSIVSNNSNIPMTKQIKDIKEGEQVLTYDETSGQFVPQIVEKLLVKGVQQVFELETISGKKIRTTEEHPYLSQPEPLAKGDLTGSGLFEEGNIGEQGAGHSQPESDSNFNIEIENIHNYLVRNFLNLKATVKDNIPKMMFTVNKPRLSGNGFSVDNGTIMATPNQPDDRLTSSSENIDNNSGSNFLTDTSVNNQWIKVKYLQAGQKIMTVDGWPASNASGEAVAGWEEIKSITKLGREEVFDIQIANTHNFVGNGIVAHNTTTPPKNSNWRGRILGILGLGLGVTINEFCNKDDNQNNVLCRAYINGQDLTISAYDNSVLTGITKLIELGIIKKGDPIQHQAIFAKLEMETIRRSGKDREDYIIDVLWPWILANGMKETASLVGMSLSSEMMNQYLYGGGADFDITNQYRKLIARDSWTASRMREGGKNPSDTEILYQFYMDIFNLYNTPSQRNDKLKDVNSWMNKDNYQIILGARNSDGSYDTKFIYQAGDRDVDQNRKSDSHFAFQSYGLALEGKVVNIVPNQNLPGYYDITFSRQTNFKVFDTYNWNDTMMYRVSTVRVTNPDVGWSLETVFDYSLKSIPGWYQEFIDLVGGEEKYFELKTRLDKYKIPNTGSDSFIMHKLANNGLATSFDNSGSYVYDKQFVITLPKILLNKFSTGYYFE